MFRGVQKSELSPKNFGAGSLLKAGYATTYLVVGDAKSVRLVRLESFEVVGKPVPVEDPNFLSEVEARELVRHCTDYTFTDFEFDTKGMK